MFLERTFAWFARFRILTVRYKRHLDIVRTFHPIAAKLICLGFVRHWFPAAPLVPCR